MILEVEKIPLDQIIIDKRFLTRMSYFNSKGETKEKEDPDFPGLVASIKKHGLLQPIGVCPIAYKEYKLLFGLRRLLAVKKLKRKTIMASIII